MTDAVADPCGIEKQSGLSAPARAGAVFFGQSELARVALFAQRFRQQFFLRLLGLQDWRPLGHAGSPSGSH
jgi:hypothetical protein